MDIDSARCSHAATEADPDLLAPRTVSDSGPLWRSLRSDCPVHWDAATGSWYVSRRADVLALALDRRLAARGYPSWVESLPPADREVVQPVERFLARWLVFSDEPASRRVRRHLQTAFTRAAIDTVTDAFRLRTRQVIADVPLGTADFVRNVARPIARATVEPILGIRPDETSELEAWSDALIDYLATPGADVALARTATSAIERCTEFILDVALPREEGLVSAVLNRLLTTRQAEPDDIVATFTQLITGALEPVATAIAAAAVRLRTAPIMRQRLCAESRYREAFIEEVLRMDPPFHFAPRTARQGMSVHGRQIHAGDRVVLLLSSANREGRADRTAGPDSGDAGPGEAPEAFSPTVPARRHVSFGHGAHYCLGATATRTFLDAALAELGSSQVVDRIEPDMVVLKPMVGATGYERIPMAPAASVQAPGADR
ncbi:cytochrome P450 [Streptosporangium roseum]|uniref:Cytochrome P450-like protein n=1 Tax=Streptosporangium roseum (strain ATCC 12428 / DSM 43021 / JCM 3005 / KCTC 9067 / NCIMB 10171 / NRRL 2505 / NI 9100) TaxID=479432 RepID=D2AZV8_STRRD|nr:cytochrome P450 [Streptosporangium roseum]ACZ87192.1 Cytochrome P450-like protein [Streptosporangium roseum DSM 43021]